ncbi:MAG: transglycosylase SLT domain-containing protein, partial [Nitrospinaceae bacterium]
ANQALREFLKLYPHHARVQEAWFSIGRNLWNLGKNREGIEHFQKVLKKDPSSQWAVKALFFTGRLYEEKKTTYPLALENYAAVVERYGEDEFAQWAAWRLGWVHYLDENYEQAFEKFREAAERYPAGFFVENNLYWSAKAAEKLGKTAEARDIYNEVHDRYPYTYYGIRGSEKLKPLNPSKSDNPGPEKKNAESTIEEPQAFAERQPGPGETFHYTRAVELTGMGFYQNARGEIRQLEKSVRKNLSGVMWLSGLYNRARGYANTLRILHLFKDFKTKQREKELPDSFWKNFFPMAYTDTIRDQSIRHNVDPFFVKGLIRQESLFDTESISPAGARGLMQIMPDTGKKLYRPDQNGKPFDTEFLFDPDLNIRLGIKYLSQLRKRFGQNGAHTLISYNAGPEVLKKWLKRFSDLNDQDVFIESIPYPETRRYVKHVLRNYGIYRILYPLPAAESGG